MAVAGFEPLDILQAVAELVDMVEEGRPAVSNSYARSVTRQGNRTALGLMDRVFEVGAAHWRGLGLVPASGLTIRADLAASMPLACFRRSWPYPGAQGLPLRRCAARQ